MKFYVVFRHDYKLVFGVDPSLDMTKAERLEYGDSSMSHAMVFTGVTYQVKTKILGTLFSGRWRK